MLAIVYFNCFATPTMTGLHWKIEAYNDAEKSKEAYDNYYRNEQVRLVSFWLGDPNQQN